MAKRSEHRIVKSTCRLCYNNCGILVHIENGKPVKVEGDPSHPVNRGLLCEKGLASLEYLDSPYRLKHPLKRVGARGAGNWKQISWEEALDTVADAFITTKKTYGVESIQIIRGGHKGIVDAYLARFANVLGTPNIASMAHLCFVPGVKASEFTYGYYAVPDLDFTPRCIVVWGCDPASSLSSSFNDIVNALGKGTKLIVIDPIKSQLAEKADLWLQLRPGTDLALALSMINVIVSEESYDKEFVRNWTAGFGELKGHAQDYSPGTVAEITWLDKEKIIQAARIYASNKPACIQWGNGIETNVNSIQTCRAIAILRALTGNLGIPGGEVKWSGPGLLQLSSKEFTCQDEIPDTIRNKRLSMNDELAPFAYYVLPQDIVKAILHEDPYPIRMAYILGGNILSSYTNTKETYEALMKLDFLTVADMFMTPTAMLADVILPVASYLEFDSIEQPCHVPIASVQQKVATVGESWSDMKILNDLAKKLNLLHFWNDVNDSLDWILKPAGITFDEFRKIGILPGTKTYRHYEKDGFDTPSGKVELFLKEFEEWGFDPLPIYHELPETPYSEPALGEEYPLIAVSKKSKYYKHSRDRQISSLRKMHPEPVVKINCETALKMGIEQGDIVYIETRRGRIEQKANLIEDIDPRVVEIDYAWYFPERNNRKLLDFAVSNINILTDNKPPWNREMGTPTLRGFSCKIYKK